MAYLPGWMAFDKAEHVAVHRYFGLAVKLAAPVGDPPPAGPILRAMACQTIDLGFNT